MGGLRQSRWLSFASAGLACLILALAALSCLPLVRSDTWWVRYADFPRLQFAIALAGLLCVYLSIFLVRRGGSWKSASVVAGLALLVIAWHAETLYPYSGLSAPSAIGAEACPGGATLKVMVANVQKRNEEADAFRRLVSDADPDLLLILETDRWWDRHLAPLEPSFSDHVQYIPEDEGAFGLHFFSKTALAAHEFRFFFGVDTPTLFADARLPGGANVQFIGLHPHPPLAWSQPASLRDGSILKAALEARSSQDASILAGDFNAVPWEGVTRRAARVGGLLDPRVGRGFYASFKAGNPVISWPLDQILFQDSFTLGDFAVLPDFGSDHFPVMAELCYRPDRSGAESAPELQPDDLQDVQASFEAARRAKPE